MKKSHRVFLSFLLSFESTDQPEVVKVTEAEAVAQLLYFERSLLESEIVPGFEEYTNLALEICSRH